jgi:hypothetical protein
MNVIIAFLLNKWDSEGQCIWYFVNIVIDCSVGVLIAFLLLKGFTTLALKFGHERLRTGEYFLTSEKPDLKAWLMQLGVWCIVVLITKWALVGVIYLLRGILGNIGELLLSPLASTPQLELIVVMVLIPCLMNMLQLWVQDNFLKGSSHREPGKPLIDLNSTLESVEVLH